jgi:tRNA (mo5U34)-methyltransferase
VATSSSLAARVGQFGWYHTIELGEGVVTPGMFDHRPVLDRYRLPADLTGARCLDVGTFDGFWAFEMERRGAAEVIGLDVDDAEQLDWPASLRHTVDKALDETKPERFELARSSLGSNVRRVVSTIYELDPSVAGVFDLVFCGDVLLHLKDPVTALERMRSVCRGRVIVCNPVKEFRFARGRALAELDGVDEFQWWITNLAGLARMVRAAGFERVTAAEPFELPATGGGAWKGLRGVVVGHADREGVGA